MRKLLLAFAITAIATLPATAQTVVRKRVIRTPYGTTVQRQVIEQQPAYGYGQYGYQQPYGYGYQQPYGYGYPRGYYQQPGFQLNLGF